MKLIIIFLIVLIIFLLVGFFISCNTLKIVSGDFHIYKGQRLPYDFEPSNLRELNDRASYLKTKQYLVNEAKISIEKLIADAENDGLCLVVFDSYRNPQRQEEIWNIVKDENPEKLNLIALPFQSEHQTGLAVDFVGCPMKDGKRDDSIERQELKESFEKLPEYNWLKLNAHNYGFEQSYREDNIDVTGYLPELWHWKFIRR